ncbi:hypothetical protein FA13DRAFT_1356393 [Coprinellus micaceus]|uniref:Uncharacterized protein n=1 Tax=Coprinellus micaceus TaxID=71717 RepID=A0A4Y7TPW0_COPMI|nr:hypothetical protein FA13DRAFT_1356393 [Coprinellus micaceus]
MSDLQQNNFFLLTLPRLKAMSLKGAVHLDFLNLIITPGLLALDINVAHLKESDSEESDDELELDWFDTPFRNFIQRSGCALRELALHNLWGYTDPEGLVSCLSLVHSIQRLSLISLALDDEYLWTSMQEETTKGGYGDEKWRRNNELDIRAPQPCIINLRYSNIKTEQTMEGDKAAMDELKELGVFVNTYQRLRLWYEDDWHFTDITLGRSRALVVVVYRRLETRRIYLHLTFRSPSPRFHTHTYHSTPNENHTNSRTPHSSGNCTNFLSILRSFLLL